MNCQRVAKSYNVAQLDKKIYRWKTNSNLLDEAVTVLPNKVNFMSVFTFGTKLWSCQTDNYTGQIGRQHAGIKWALRRGLCRVKVEAS